VPTDIFRLLIGIINIIFITPFWQQSKTFSFHPEHFILPFPRTLFWRSNENLFPAAPINTLGQVRVIEAK